MKFHKTILVLTAIIIILLFDDAGSQVVPKDPFIPTPPPPPPPPTKSPLPPPKTPPISPPSPTPTFPPPPPPPPSKSLPTPPPPPSSPIFPPPVSPTPSFPFTPSSSSSAPSFFPPSSSPPKSTSSSSSPSPTPSRTPQSDCSASLACPDPQTYCNISAGKCKPKGKFGDSCNNDDNECLSPYVCRENTCEYIDAGTNNKKKNDEHYNVKKVAVVGAVIVGVSGVCALVFFVIRYLKKKRDYDIASRLYSTDDDMSETDPYPFAERSNSFSKNTVQPPRAPTTNRYDNLPPTGNRGYVAPRPGYHNYYNKYNNEGLYMRQNRQNEEGVTRAMNLLQQTRGNVMITPQQNYNWNPQNPPNPPAMRINQSGLFPIPSVNGNHVVLPPNNNTNNMNNMRNFNNINNNINTSGEDDDSKHDNVVKSYSVDYTNDHNNHQRKHHTRKDSNTLSADDVNLDIKNEEAKSNPHMPSASALKSRNVAPSYSDSILDSYANESIFAKTLEEKLSKSSVKNDNNNTTNDSSPLTIQQNVSRTQTYPILQYPNQK